MSRTQMLIMATCLLVLATGCRNRGCNNPCGGGMFAGGSSTIAPPQTYSLNIPSVARNQPYYTPGSGNTGTLSTYGRAPTPVRQAQQNQAGWKGAGTDLSNSNTNVNSNTNNGQQQNPNPGQSVLAAPTTFVETNGNRNNTIQNNTIQNGLNPNSANLPVRTASAQPLPGTGQSFTNSQNYQSTQGDERNDPSRLTVTDASQVRAPARNYPAGYSNQVPQTYVAQNPAYYAQPTIQQRGYVANPMIVGNPSVGYQSQAVMMAPGQYSQQYPQQYSQQYPTSSQPTVLAQSTTSTPSGSSTQLGWRDRDLTNGRTGRF